MLTTNQRKPVETPPVKIRAVLIDPFKCEYFPLVVDWADQKAVHNLLDCDLARPIMLGPYNAIWIDECGLLREPFIYPQWKIGGINGDCPVSGYGLVTGFDHETNKVTDVELPPLAIIFEHHWPRRIHPDKAIDQLLRVYFQPKW